ncbi:MAG: DUF4126 domain-containing protein [Verrucomicrobiae bacterium]
MDELQTLGVALGLASLAGINLYLTVFVAGLAVRMDWVALPLPLAGLEALASPAILGVAGFLYLVEFFADKIPWIDTAWDSVHTFIRPVGAAAIAVAALGEARPSFEIVGALLAGGMALTSHVAKSGTRLAANASPEPVSNIFLSIAEDGIVIAGLGLVAWCPVAALAVSLAFALAVLILLPRLLRGIRAKLWLAWKKLNAPPEEEKGSEPGRALPGACELQLRRACASKAPVAWSAPCLSGGGARLTANLRGWLVALEAEPQSLFFIGRSLGGGIFLTMDVAGAAVEHRSGFLCDKIEIAHRDGSPRHTFLFECAQTKIARRIAGLIQAPRDPG